MEVLYWIYLAQDNGQVVGFCESGLHKMQGISLLAEDLLASQEGLSSMELVSQ
jgi:hypothetical protein